MKSKTKRKVFICPKCGLPNIVGDSMCMYCQIKFTKVQLFALWLKAIFQEKKQDPEHKQGQKNSVIRRIAPSLVGIGVILFGLFLFTKGLLAGSFQNWIVSIICFLTGYQLLKSK